MRTPGDLAPNTAREAGNIMADNTPAKATPAKATPAKASAGADAAAADTKTTAPATPPTTPVKRTRVQHEKVGIDLAKLSVEDAPAPVRTVAGRNPAENPFVGILRDLWLSRPNAGTDKAASKSAGKAVTVPVAAEREVTNAIRAAANYHTAHGLPMGVAIDTDKAGDGSRPVVAKGQVRIRFAAKQRKNKGTRTA